MTYRVIQWATGGVGRASIEGIVEASDPSDGPFEGFGEVLGGDLPETIGVIDPFQTGSEYNESTSNNLIGLGAAGLIALVLSGIGFWRRA